VGYGAEHGLTRPSRLAIVAVGYADGYVRMLGSSDAKPGAAGYIGGHRAPILGRVSMDLITLDVTEIPEKMVYRGAMVELLGDHVRLDDLAKIAGTIDYEILTRLGRRHQRIYLDA
jgi:alanine racemase